LFYTWKGWTGLFCPCVLFGRNIESLRDDTPWTTPCVCHAVCVEGGIALAAATAVFHGINPDTPFLICEGLLFAWWMCGIYTGLVRQSLQKKYHLKVIPIFSIFMFMLWIEDSKDPQHTVKVKKSITWTFCRCRQDDCFWIPLVFYGTT
jgi:Cys-rich protein (TIGR01571 family)